MLFLLCLKLLFKLLLKLEILLNLKFLKKILLFSGLKFCQKLVLINLELLNMILSFEQLRRRFFLRQVLLI